MCLGWDEDISGDNTKGFQNEACKSLQTFYAATEFSALSLLDNWSGNLFLATLPEPSDTVFYYTHCVTCVFYAEFGPSNCSHLILIRQFHIFPLRLVWHYIQAVRKRGLN